MKKHIILEKSLYDIYKQYIPDFDDYEHLYNDSNINLLVGLYPEVVDEVELIYDFVEKNNKYIKAALRDRNYILFKQPVIILAMYLVKNRRGDIHLKWPFSNYLLEEIFDSLCIGREI